MTLFDAVFIDVGHGGVDPGTGAYQARRGKRYTHTDADPEWTYHEGVHNRRHGARLARLLLAAGVPVYSVAGQRRLLEPPDLDGTSFAWKDVSLRTRVCYANAVFSTLRVEGQQCCLVSIHGNALGTALRGPSLAGDGVAVFTNPGHSAADVLCDSITAAYRRDPDLGLRVRGGKFEAGFYMVRKTWMPAVLVEAGFFTHLPDAERMASDAGSDAIAQGIFEGLVPHLATQTPS